MQQLVERGGIDALDGLLPGDQALGGHVHCDLEGRFGGALAGAGLQHPELAVLDGELHVLHVAVVALQQVEVGLQLREGAGHDLLERRRFGMRLDAGLLGDVLRRADAGHHVFTLCIHKELAVELLRARGRVAGEGNAGGRGVTHVAEHHGLDVDRRAPVFGDVVELAVGDGACAHPRLEHRANGTPQLLMRVLREGLARGLLHQSGIADDEALPFLRRHFRVEGVAALVLEAAENVLELVMIDAEHHVRIHRDEAAVAVEGEAPVARARGQALDSGVVEAEVQHRVHHARHRGARA